jgi:hypothetical protein
MTRADRFPMWRFRRLNDEQRVALDLLRWYSPSAADRARAKNALGWRRTKEETIALAQELLAEGRILLAVANELGVGARYLRRLLAGVSDLEKPPRNRPTHKGKVALTRDSKGLGHPRGEQG